MKKIHFLIISALILAMASFNECKEPTKSPNMSEIPTTIIPLDSCKQLDDFLSNKVIIINSEDELAKYIDCGDEMPDIDFTEQTLLLARGMAPAMIKKIIPKLLTNGESYFLNVEIQLVYSEPQGNAWRIGLSTEKLTTDSIDLNTLSY
ncbi:MAG: hypothetical protein FWD66_10035 [Paludibacter sp.]|nr:hypothetical protein [Paludibacter sp.]